jgi:hypothetical protein
MVGISPTASIKPNPAALRSIQLRLPTTAMDTDKYTTITIKNAKLGYVLLGILNLTSKVNHYLIPGIGIE